MRAYAGHDPVDGDLDLDPHRALGERQRLGDLALRQPLLPVEQEHRAAAFGQIVYETANQLLDFGLYQPAIGSVFAVGGGNFGRSARWESPRTRGSGGAYGTPSDTGSPRCARRRRGRRRCFRSSAARRGTSRRRRRRCSRPRRRPPCCAENSRRTGKRSGNRDHRKPGKRNRRSRLRKQANSQVLFSSPRPGMFRLSQDKIRKLFQNRNIRFR